MSRSQRYPAASLKLEYPMSLGVFKRYITAQHSVGYLADPGFAVQNLEIVGTELRSVERVTGRLTRGKIAAAGALSGLWIGLFVGVVFSLFAQGNQLGVLIATPVLGAVFGLVWSKLGFAAGTRYGNRAFASVSHIVATRCEMLVARTHAARARELLAAMPQQVAT